jgi:hypothetical protein
MISVLPSPTPANGYFLAILENLFSIGPDVLKGQGHAKLYTGVSSKIF